MVGVNRPIIKHYASHGGNFLDSQYLANWFDNIGKPYMFDFTMKLFSAKDSFINAKVLLGMTGAKEKNKIEIEGTTYRWKLQGAQEHFCRSMGVVDPSNTTPGLNNTTFRIKLDVNYYREPDVLMGPDNEYLLPIVDGPVVDGTGYIYTVRIEGNNPSVFYPLADLEAGVQYSKVTTAIQHEYNQIRGTQQYGGRFMLEGQVSTFGNELHITDEMWRQQGYMGLDFQTVADGSSKAATMTKVLPMAEALMLETLYNDVEFALMYGKKETRPAKDGYPIVRGAGIREQLKGSWREYYNGAMTIQRIDEFMRRISFSRTASMEMNTTWMTGKMGRLLFHRMLAGDARAVLSLDTNFTQSNGNVGGVPHLAYGAVYDKYCGPFGTVALTLNPQYDSLKYDGRQHPAFPGTPLDSFRWTALDFAETESGPNITFITRKNTFLYGYNPGTLTPTGPVKNGGAFGSLKNGYSVACEMSGGVVIKDVSRCAEMILEIF